MLGSVVLEGRKKGRKEGVVLYGVVGNCGCGALFPEIAFCHSPIGLPPTCTSKVIGSGNAPTPEISNLKSNIGLGTYNSR